MTHVTNIILKEFINSLNEKYNTGKSKIKTSLFRFLVNNRNNDEIIKEKNQSNDWYSFGVDWNNRELFWEKMNEFLLKHNNYEHFVANIIHETEGVEKEVFEKMF